MLGFLSSKTIHSELKSDNGKLEAEIREQILPQVSSWNTVTTCWQYQAVVQDGASVYFQFAFIVEKLNLP